MVISKILTMLSSTVDPSKVSVLAAMTFPIFVLLAAPTWPPLENLFGPVPGDPSVVASLRRVSKGRGYRMVSVDQRPSITSDLFLLISRSSLDFPLVLGEWIGAMCPTLRGVHRGTETSPPLFPKPTGAVGHISLNSRQLSLVRVSRPAE